MVIPTLTNGGKKLLYWVAGSSLSIAIFVIGLWFGQTRLTDRIVFGENRITILETDKVWIREELTSIEGQMKRANDRLYRLSLAIGVAEEAVEEATEAVEDATKKLKDS